MHWVGYQLRVGIGSVIGLVPSWTNVDTDLYVAVGRCQATMSRNGAASYD